MKEWYSSKEAADYLGIPLHRLGRLRREKRITGVVGGGDNPRYAMYHIDELKKVDTSDLRKRGRVREERPSEEKAAESSGENQSAGEAA
jgi:hypothetical protein